MSNLLYFDAYSGLSGDMTLGALLDLGLPLDYLQTELAKLKVPGFSLEKKTVEQHHINGLKLEVNLVDPHEHTHRSITDIEKIIRGSGLAERAQERALAVFWNLARVEGAIHNLPPEEVHFHEVGAVDAIVDIVGSCLGFEYFDISEFYCSPLPVGSGFVRAAHGLMPVPAPATLQLLAEAGAALAPTVTLSNGAEYPARAEMVTPTGAALVATLCQDGIGQRPPMKISGTGYGFGSKEFAWPNALRLWLGSRISNPKITPATVSELVTGHANAHDHDHSHDEEHSHSHEAGHVHTHEDGHTHSHSHGETHDHSHDEKHAHSHDHPENHSHSHKGHSHSHEHTVNEMEHAHDHAGAETTREKLNGHTAPAHHQESGPLESKSGQETYFGHGEVSLIEANLDDMTGEALGYLMEKLLAAKALDVYFTPIMMKKNRPATKLSVVAHPADEARLAALVIRESSTFGVRCYRMNRYTTGRQFRQVETSAGTAQVKLKIVDGEIIEAVPEYDSVAELARRTGRPWRQVYEEVRQSAHEFLVKSQTLP
jgi:uncharacterized protein (DUF111 family)